MTSIEMLKTPPPYCHYADGACDQSFSETCRSEGVFLYPADPEPMACAIEAAATILTQSNSEKQWLTWHQFKSAGQVVFCAICSHMRFCDVVIADVTTLNFNLILDMKPEGHQFTKLREEVLTRMSQGLQEHTLTAFWTYILLCELCHKVIGHDSSWAQRDHERARLFGVLRELFESLMPNDTGDFSERLLRQVDRLATQFDALTELTSGRVTEVLFTTEIPQLEKAVSDYLAHKSKVWMLIDNLDKGWPTRGASPEDILIIRTLLEATRKIQQQLEKHGGAMHSLVFLRNDIHDLLVRQTSDRDKDTPVIVNWDDPEAFKELVLQRIKAATGLNGSFEDVWAAAFDRNVGTQDSFAYVAERTLMRPRDLIRFLRKAVEVAVNRGHQRVQADDFTSAESTYSEELLVSINYEVGDVAPLYTDLLYLLHRLPQRHGSL